MTKISPPAERRPLHRDERGASLVEFALALPILVTLYFGIFACGSFYWAQNSLNHSVGEASRYATTWPTPTDTQIATLVRSREFAMNANRATEVSVVRGTVNGATNYVEVQASSAVTLDLVFFRLGPIPIVARSRSYVAAS